jgi:hypothetical protein
MDRYFTNSQRLPHNDIGKYSSDISIINVTHQITNKNFMNTLHKKNY